jgi:hypothetical protein
MNYEKVPKDQELSITMVCGYFSSAFVHYIDISKDCMKIQDMHTPLHKCHINWQIYIFMINIQLDFNKFTHFLVS